MVVNNLKNNYVYPIYTSDTDDISLNNINKIHVKNIDKRPISIKAQEENEVNLDKFDHRVLGKNMNLFSFCSISGVVSWHKNGFFLLEQLKNYIRTFWKMNNYNEVVTPIIYNCDLWKKSGHWDVFTDNMIKVNVGNEECALKPMNCPGHGLLFNLGNKSYRDLPYKMSEFGCCHRNEPSGALQGLLRTRSFTQDDSHVFCTLDQIEGVVTNFCNMLLKIYKHLRFDEVKIYLSTRPDKFIGSESDWVCAEHVLHKIAQKETRFNYEIAPGEGAFYGPKLEFHIKDRNGRFWQCGTVQIDFSLCKRLDVRYTDKDGERKHPIVIHHAVLGSLERFVAILLEDRKGVLENWLAPINAVIIQMTNNDKISRYVQNVLKQLDDYRVIIDNNDDTLSSKVKRWIEERVPIQIVIGEKESNKQELSVRILGENLQVINFSQIRTFMEKNI